MGLWVKSQNKKDLIEVNHLRLEGNKIKGYRTMDGLGLGKYETPERALEVFNSIMNNMKESSSTHLVFEMPEE